MHCVLLFVRNCSGDECSRPSNSGPAKEQDDDAKRLWKYVTKIRTARGSGGRN